jgi:hypothetical protein
MKTCTKCKVNKLEEDFSPSQLKLQSSRCKECVSIVNKEWRDKNPEKVKENSRSWYENNTERAKARTSQWKKDNPEKNAANSRNWSKNNPEKKAAMDKKYREENLVKVREMEKRWRKENPEKKKASNKKWAEENYEQILEYQKQYLMEKYHNDPAHRNRVLASAKINEMLKSQGSSKKGHSFLGYVEWTLEELCSWIANQFEPWMNWDNQGRYDSKTWEDNDPGTWKWQLDHIIPHSDLPYDNMEHPNFKKAWALSNLRPLSAKQNLLDGANRTRHLNKRT